MQAEVEASRWVEPSDAIDRTAMDAMDRATGCAAAAAAAGMHSLDSHCYAAAAARTIRDSMRIRDEVAAAADAIAAGC